MRKEKDAYTCGVRIPSDLRISDGDHTHAVVTDRNEYLVLASSVTGDYDRYADMLLAFARENGMAADQEGIFTVYDAKEDFDNPKIRMYCPVKVEMI